MNKDIVMLILAALVGSIFTIIVQIVLHSNRNVKIRKAVNSILLDIIRPSLTKFELEIPKIQEAMNTSNSPDQVLGMHPELNSHYLRSFSLVDLRSAYKNKLQNVIAVMAILDHLEKRTPIICFEEWIEYCATHLVSHFDEYSHQWNDEESHLINCYAVCTERSRAIKNLELINQTLDELNRNIDIIVKHKI